MGEPAVYGVCVTISDLSESLAVTLGHFSSTLPSLPHWVISL